MKTSVLIVFVFSLLLSGSVFAQKPSPSVDDEVLLRLTAEPMPGDVRDVPVTLRRVDKPGPPIELVASPGAVDAAVIAPGVYELVSQTPIEINGQQFRWEMQVPIFDHITRVRLSMANAIPVSSVAATPPQPVQSNSATAKVPSDTKPSEPLVEVEVKMDPSIDGIGVGTSTTLIELRRLDRAQAPITSTISNGLARLRVAPGRYEIVTPQPVSIGAREYSWDMEAPLTDPVNHVQLSDWQALVLNSGDANLPRQTQRTEQVSGKTPDRMK